jgi:hypothetical protein
MSGPDRLGALLAQDAVTGIDFVAVHADHETVDVFFLRAPDTMAPSLEGTIDVDQVEIADESNGETLPVTLIGWTTVDQRHVLRISAPGRGRFAWHDLSIDHPRIDPWWGHVRFSFAATCPSPFDCADPPLDCPTDEADTPIDYLARDFWSLRRALLDMASLRHPDWQDRLDPDVGIMLTELFSAQGDDFAYQQDRTAREATLETASLRRSLRGHARLVDYELDDGQGSQVWIDVTASAGQSGLLATGTHVLDASGTVVFELGRGLRSAVVAYSVDSTRNRFDPWIWDQRAQCLPLGSVGIDVIGHVAADLPFDDFPVAQPAGKWMLLRTDPTDLSVPVRSWPVRVIDIVEGHDPVFNQDVTHLQWDPTQATPWDLDLTVLQVRGNLLPATAGESCTVEARVETDPPTPVDGLAPTASAPEG